MRAAVYRGTGDVRVEEIERPACGPGEILGWRQSGFPAFRYAAPLRDLDLLEAARSEAALSAREPATILPGPPAAVPPVPAAPASSEKEIPSPCSPS